MTNRRGFALMLVLWIVVILAAICTGVATATRRTTNYTIAYRARLVARYGAESGITATVAIVQDSLAMLTDGVARRDYLNELGVHRFTLNDAEVDVAIIDIGSRLDLRMAAKSSLAKLFTYFTTQFDAEQYATAVHDYMHTHTVTDLDDLRAIRGIAPALMDRALPYLTLDGDGTINRATVSDTVLSAAGGELRDEPSRLLIVSRAIKSGESSFQEIQAVYAVVANDLVLMRWREAAL